MAAQTGSSPRAETVGALLRLAREQTGQDVETVAQALCIRRRYIEAIESGRYQDLPGKTYALGFIRTYAGYLDLNPDQVAERFRRERLDGEVEHELHFPVPVAEGSAPKGAILFLCALLVVIAYGVWYVVTSPGTALVTFVQPVPERFAAWFWSGPRDAIVPPRDEAGPGHEAVGVAVLQPTSPSVASEPTPADIEPPGQLPQAPTITAPAAPAIATVALVETDMATARMTEPGHEPASVPPEVAEAETRVVLRATADCWIEVKDQASGRLVFARLLRSGDVYPVPDQPGLKLLAGNAGGLEVFVDGRKMPPLGRQGMVLRNIDLAPDRLAPRSTNVTTLAPAGPLPERSE